MSHAAHVDWEDEVGTLIVSFRTILHVARWLQKVFLYDVPRID
jgi:hypothetical protein